MAEIDPLIKVLLERKHAPANAQKNSDITKDEIEAALLLSEHWGKFVRVNASGNALEFVEVEPGAAYDGDPNDIEQDAEHRFVSDSQINDWDGKADDGHDHSGVYEPVKGSDDNYVTDAEKTKLGHISVSQAVDLDDIETRVNNLDAAVVLKGTWDASAGTFPGGGTAQAGASYIVSVAGTVDSIAFAIGDRAIAIIDNASTNTYAANWFKADYTDQVLSVNGLTGAVTLSTANVADSADKRYCTDAQKTVIGNTSNTNTGDETGATIRTKLGSTTVGTNINTLTNPSAITFLRVNADNTVTARSAADFKTDLSITGDDIVYAPTLADVAINNVADVTVQTKDLTGIVAGDQVIIEGEFLILNNSTATRVYIITIDFDNVFDIELTTPALATSATLMHPFMFRAVCTIRSTSLAYGMASLDMQLAAGIASGGDTTMAATHLSCKGWGETASNLTGTLTCNLKIRSAAGTATQTYRPISFTIRKTSPIG